MNFLPNGKRKEEDPEKLGKMTLTKQWKNLQSRHMIASTKRSGRVHFCRLENGNSCHKMDSICVYTYKFFYNYTYNEINLAHSLNMKL